MSAALRRVTSRHYVRLPRMCFTLPHPTTTERAVWQQAAVRPGPPRRPRARAELTPFESVPSPSPFCLKAQLAPLHQHAYHQLAQQGKSPPQSTPTKEDPSVASKVVISNAEQRRRDWAIIRRLAVHIWPKDDWETRGRVVLGVGLLVGGKVRSLSPFIRMPSEVHP
jgi:hypothetical protein